MKISSINVGDELKGKVTEDLEKPFTGIVEKIYTNSVLLSITDFDKQDEDSVSELNHKLVVSAGSVKKVSKK